MLSVNDLSIYLISWPGVHDDARQILKKLNDYHSCVTVIYSETNDDDVEFDVTSIKTSSNFLWEKKFHTVLNLCSTKVCLFIHSDCTCDDWSGLVDRCLESHSNYRDIGVWAPLISGTPFKLQRTSLGNSHVGDENLISVVNCDGIIFSLNEVVQIKNE